jgi:hypothetical protein
MSPPRYWTVDEAREVIPELRQLLEGLKRSSTLASRVRSNGHATLGNAAGESSPEPWSSDIQPVLDELERSGIILRDPARGLVDFPAMHLGRVVQLCWQLGEDDLAWWHFPDEGFAGRHPLPLPAEW